MTIAPRSVARDRRFEMLTDQELIEGLQAELALVQPPVDLIDRLRRQAAAGGDRGRLRRRSHNQRRRRVPGGSAALIASGLVAIAVAAGALVLAGHRTPNAKQATSTSRPAWLSELASRFAVLNTRPTPLPSAVAQELATYGVPVAGLRFAHRVVFPAGTVWIIPEPSELCLALVLPGDRGPGGETCSPGKDGVRLSEGRREHLDQPPGPDNPLRAHKAGIVTDEVTAVRVYPPNQPPVTIPVKDNAFLVATSPGTPVKLSR
jgi:hypothetical protein